MYIQIKSVCYILNTNFVCNDGLIHEYEFVCNFVYIADFRYELYYMQIYI